MLKYQWENINVFKSVCMISDICERERKKHKHKLVPLFKERWGSKKSLEALNKGCSKVFPQRAKKKSIRLNNIYCYLRFFPV